jgi:hypothetical protein
VISSLAILVDLAFPSQTVRFWDGAGPMLVGGFVYRGSGAVSGLDELEYAVNGEASRLDISVSGVPADLADLAYQEYLAGDVIGSPVRVMIQPMDEFDQPSGILRVPFTGRIDNLRFDDAVQGGAESPQAVSQMTIEVTNRFDLRNLSAGGVLSDADQKLRHPGDRFCERVPKLADKTVVWPDFA